MQRIDRCVEDIITIAEIMDDVDAVEVSVMVRRKDGGLTDEIQMKFEKGKEVLRTKSVCSKHSASDEKIWF